MLDLLDDRDSLTLANEYVVDYFFDAELPFEQARVDLFGRTIGSMDLE